MERTGGGHHREREGVLVPAQAANLAPVPSLGHNHVTLAAFPLVRIENRLAQSLRPPAADRGEIRTQTAPPAINLMTGGARTLAEEDAFSSRRVAGNLLPDHATAEA